MIYFAVGLAVAGAAIGLAYRWKVLLPIVVLLPVAAIIFSLPRGLTYGEMAVIVIGAEAILQGGYFAGLLIRFVVIATMRLAGASSVQKNQPDPTSGNDHHGAPAGGQGS
jgi:hypothetical protein